MKIEVNSSIMKFHPRDVTHVVSRLKLKNPHSLLNQSITSFSVQLQNDARKDSCKLIEVSLGEFLKKIREKYI